MNHQMTKVSKHLDMLGRQAEDRVTGFKGVVGSVYFGEPVMERRHGPAEKPEAVG